MSNQHLLMIAFTIAILAFIIYCIISIVLLSAKTKQIAEQLAQQETKHINEFQQLANQLIQLDEKTHKTAAQSQSLEIKLENANQTIVALTSQLNQTQQKLTLLSEQQPEDKLYSRALKLAALGADVNELVQECQMSPAEAEMLLAIHQRKS
jgi:rubrerythrin